MFRPPNSRNQAQNALNEVTKKDYKDLLLKPDYQNKAIYCGKDGHIFLETFCKYYKEISDFLIAIGEPLHRTKDIHEFCLNTYSLYAAASMNIKTKDIISILNNLSKNELPPELIKLIEDNTETYGKVKLLLKNKRYFIECNNRDILMRILYFPRTSESYNSILQKNSELNKQLQNQPIKIHNDNIISVNVSNTIKKIMEEEKEQDENDNIPSNGSNYFEIDPAFLEVVKKECIDRGYPLIEEYEFKNDKNLPPLEISPKLKSPTRGYQEKALGIMFSNERARSGIIVLPCGAGKTLVGILATCTVKKNTIILCNSGVSVQQWYEEVINWTTIKRESIARLTSKSKDGLWDVDKKGGILIASYTMMAFGGKRNPEVEKIMQKIKNTEWGLMILDEVQVLPAQMFRKIINLLKAHCKLGLTATLVREDEKIKDLNFLIGPKHYEANWLDLQRDGYLARVKCIEIWCEMSVDFYAEYLKSDSARRKKLYVTNPIKFFICKALIEKHKKDKIIIFSDDLFALKLYEEELKCPSISGKVPERERNALLNQFRDPSPNGINCLLMSKVGDTSLDLPNAKVIIQISSHFGSRRQEAQRLGRILRPKKDVISEYNAFFYTIITKNTEEMYFSNKRHRFLVDQGYYFKVVTDLYKELGIKVDMSDRNFGERVLKEMKNMNEEKYQEEDIADNDFLDNEIYKGKNKEIIEDESTIIDI